MTDIYTKQLEDENEKLRSQLVKAQETIDYCGATWKEEINDSEVIYRLCLGNFCLAVIIESFAGEYKCHIIKLSGEKWYWSQPVPAFHLVDAKDGCEYALGFGKNMSDNLKKINENAVEWMTRGPTIGRSR